MDIHNCCFISKWLAIMDIHNSIMDIHNSIMDIHNSIMDMTNSQKVVPENVTCIQNFQIHCFT